MDKSKEYILMCEKAVEIQELWNPDNADCVKGDFVGYIKESTKEAEYLDNTWKRQFSISRFCTNTESYGKYAWYLKEELIWLPRQDQLQEMIKDKYESLYDLWDAFGYFFVNNDSYFEQGWLMFVMKEKYNKVWNGSDWVENG